MKFLLLRTDQVGWNNRTYPKELVLDVIRDESFQNRLKNRQLIGYFGQTTDLQERNLEDASHIVTDVYIEGNDVFGDIEILDTPAGKHLLQSLKNGDADFGMGLKGIGDIEMNENGENVVTSLQVMSFDYVYKPSFKKKK